MKIKFQLLLGMLAFLMGITQTAAQKMRFFRIFGPTITTITAFRPDGTLVWSNAQQGGIYTIQTTSCLVGESNWVDYVAIPAASGANTNLLIDFSPPAGMTLIPAGAFTMGDTINDVSSGDDNSPTTVTVSAFYMDVCLISYSQWQSVFIWATDHGYSFDLAGSGKAPNHPVQTVNWYDTVKWCNARSQQTGLTPVYYTDAGLTQV